MKNLNLILDADALWFVANNKEISEQLKQLNNVILTPNLIEFKRLQDSFNIQSSLSVPLEIEVLNDNTKPYVGEVSVDDPIVVHVVEMSRLLGCTIVRKGPIDLITDGKEALYVMAPGS